MNRASIPKGLTYYRKGGGCFKKKQRESKICAAGKAWAKRTGLTHILRLMPTWRLANIAKTQITRKKPKGKNLVGLKKWRDQKWVRIDREATLLAKCGTSRKTKKTQIVVCL